MDVKDVTEMTDVKIGVVCVAWVGFGKIPNLWLDKVCAMVTSLFENDGWCKSPDAHPVRLDLNRSTVR